MTVEFDSLSQLKLVIIGDASVGKTSFFTRYTQDTFTELLERTGASDYLVKTIDVELNVKGAAVGLTLWDTAGQERCENANTVHIHYCRGADGIFLAYDVSHRSSFVSINGWEQAIRQETFEDVAFLLLGCKADVDDSQREVSYQEGEALAHALGMDFMETSARLDVNIGAAVEMLACKAWEKQHPPSVIITLTSVELNKELGLAVLSFTTLGGDSFETQVQAENASVQAAISSVRSQRGLREIALLTPEGVQLTPGDWLPGIPRPQAHCIAQ